MKRLLGCISLSCLLLLMTMLLSPTAVFASTGDVAVSLTSDAGEYATGDSVELTVSVKNETDGAIKDVQWSVTLPDGMELEEGEAAEGELDLLHADEVYSTTLNAIVVDASSVTQPADDDVNVQDSTHVQDNANVQNSAQQDTQEDGGESLAATGDGVTRACIALVVIGAVLVGCGLVAKRSVRRGGAFALLLFVTAAGSLFMANNAYADTLSATSTCSMVVNGKEVSASLSVSYVQGNGSTGDASYSYTLQEDVTEISDYSFSNDSYFVSAGEVAVNVGDKVTFSATEENPFGAAGVVTALEPQADGTVLILFEQATDPTEYFESLSAHSDGLELSSAEYYINGSTTESSASDIMPLSIVDTDGTWEPEDGSLSNSSRIDLGDGNYIEVKFETDPTIAYDIEWSMIGGLKQCDLDIDGVFTVTAGAHVQNEDASEYLSLLNASFPIAYGFSIDVPIDALVTLEGDIEASVDYEFDASLKYQNEGWIVTDNSEATTSFYAEAHARVGARLGVEFKWFLMTIVDAGIEAGGDATASTTLHDDVDLLCSDVQAYAYLSIDAGTRTDWLSFFGLTYSEELITEQNSPFVYAGHWENLIEVDACTYGSDDSSEPDDSEDLFNPTIPSGFEDDGSLHPELEDNGYGTDIVIDYTGGYQNGLAEPFNILEGTSLTVTATEEETSIWFYCDPGTVYRLTSWDYTTESYKTVVTVWPGGAYQAADKYCRIEVLCGRVTVHGIQSWGGDPIFTKGTCEICPYPLRLSRLSLDMSVGEQVSLVTNDSFDALDDYSQDAELFQWMSSDTSVARVDSNGNVTAVGSGTATITVYSPSWITNCFSRSCTVTVS